MVNRAKFNISQILYYIRKDLSLIIVIAISLSMVAGSTYIGESYGDHIKNNALTNFYDFNVIINGGYTITQPYVYMEVIQAYRDSDLNVQDYLLYRGYSLADTYIFKDYSSLDAEDRPANMRFAFTPCNFEFYPKNFYDSERFHEFFLINEGVAPSSSNEILVNYDVAKFLELPLNSPISLTILSGENFISEYNGKYSVHSPSYVGSIDDVVISGYYQLKKDAVETPTGNYPQIENSTEILENNIFLDTNSIFKMPIFAFHNIFNPSVENPVLDFCDYFHNNYFYSRSGEFSKMQGLLIFLDRQMFNLNNLNQEISNLDQGYFILIQKINLRCVITNAISDRLIEFKDEFQDFRLKMQMLNIPIVLFSVFIGLLSVKMKIENRFEEILLLRSLGTPDELMQTEFLLESFVAGILSSINGVVLGFGIFHILDFFLRDQMLPNVNFLELSVNPWIYLILIGIGILFTMIASLYAIVKVKKLKSGEIFIQLGRSNLETDYDEKSLNLIAKEKQKGKFKAFFAYFKLRYQELIRLDKKTRQDIRSKSKTRISLAEFESSNKKYGWWLIGISLLPFMVYLLFIIAERYPVSDNIVNIIAVIETNIDIVLIPLILSPIFLVVGCIRVIVMERKSRFAKISNFIGKLFVGDRSYLCALNILRRSGYVLIMILSGIFIAMVTFSNIGFNSMARYQTMNSNVAIGADTHIYFDLIQYNTDPMATSPLFGNYQIFNGDDLADLENTLLECRSSKNESIVNNVVTVQKEFLSQMIGSAYYSNLSRYLPIIQGNSKFLPNAQIIPAIQNVIEYNANPANEIPGAIVNQDFLNNWFVKKGDIVNYTHHYYNDSSYKMEEETLSVKILEVLEVLPGYYGVNPLSFQDVDASIVLDTRRMANGSNLLHGFRIEQLVDINKTNFPDPTETFSYIFETASPFTLYAGMDAYDYNWDSSQNVISGTLFGYLSIINIEFSILALLISMSSAILVIMIFRQDRHQNGTLLARGFGKGNLFGLLGVELFIVFLFATILGFLAGLLLIVPTLKIYTNTFILHPAAWNLPFYNSPWEIVLYSLAIPILSTFAFIGIFLIQSKEKISEYIQNF